MKNFYLFLIGFICLALNLNVSAQCSDKLTSGAGTDIQTICLNQPIQKITYSTTSADTAFFSLPDGIIGIWDSAAKVASITGIPTGAGLFKYKVTFRCTTNFSDSGTIIVKPLPFATLSINRTQVCPGENVVFTLNGTSEAVVTYSINGSSNKAILLSGGTADVTVTDVDTNQCLKLISVNNPSTGCFNDLSDSAMVTLFPPVSAHIQGSVSICQGEQQPFIVMKGSNGSAPYTFTFNINGSSNQSITTKGMASVDSVQVSTNSTGSFIYNLVSVSDYKGCILNHLDTDSAKAVVNILIKPFLTSSKSESVCNNSIFNYKATCYPEATLMSWSRDSVSGIKNSPQKDTLTDIIEEQLINITSQPVLVNYKFRLSNSENCIVTETLKVLVYPTPAIEKESDTSFCNGQFVNGLSFGSTSPGVSFKWSSSKNIGFGTKGIDNISAFSANKQGNTPDTALITVSINLNDGNCQGPDSRFKIIVLPTPELTSTSDTTICNNTVFNYSAKSSVKGINFSWMRLPNPQITPAPAVEASGSIIQETLHNLSAIPVDVKYIITMKLPGEDCSGYRTVTVRVNPTPIIHPIKDYTFCKGNPVDGIKFSSDSPNSIFTWTCSPSIGFGASGTGNIPAFIAGNSISDSVNAIIMVSVLTGGELCPGIDSKFTITVLPLLKLSSTKDTSVCDNVPFTYSAKSAANGINFKWNRPVVPGISNMPASGNDSQVNETLHNETSQPVRVKYYFTLSASPLCDTRDSVMVTVNPTPSINPVHDTAFCNGEIVNGISFTSASPDSTFVWTCDNSIGFGKSGSGGIPAFIATNMGDSPIIANISIMVKASKDRCPAPDSTRFRITVYPLLLLVSTKDTSVCDSEMFNYSARSSARHVTFSWERPAVPGISNLAAIKNDSVISETLHNTTSLPVVVKYYFTLAAGNLCYARDSIRVTVNPTPVIDAISDRTFCNGNIVNGINFSSTSPDLSFTWVSDTSIGFGKSGRGNISVFTATNPGKSPLVATVTVSVTAGKDNCPGRNESFKIIVNPSPPKPDYTWLNLHENSLCKGSENINFNITAQDQAISYLWASDSPSVKIRNKEDANPVISFPEAGNFDIKAFAINSINGGCTDSVVQTVKIKDTTGIDERRIILKQPGNLLFYPDNSMNPLNGYQWGYDSLLIESPARLYSPPKKIDGQVYQFFIPASRFLAGNVLDTTRYSYWVLVQEGSCYSRIYYNGPYARLKTGSTPPESNAVQLKVFPNPNNGIFGVALTGNIYGSVNAKIYNTFGQVVFTYNFVKNIPEISESFILPDLPQGLYYMVLNSSDLKKVVERFIIQH